jgi:hypothetical protein
VTAAVLLGAALVAFAAAVSLLRRTGPGWRVGRLLAAAPTRDLAELASMVARGEVAYVRVEGRISSEEEFPDENDNPLVYQRRRLQRRDGPGGWATFDEQRVAVPFGLAQRGEHVAIDVEALGDGLVVVPRLSEGQASDLPDGEALATRASLAANAPVRLRVDQVSATDHATAAGVPVRGSDGRPLLSAGLGRPLLLTTLEPGAAMRVLASGQRRTVVAATALLVLSAVLLALAVFVLVLGLGPTEGAAAQPTGSADPALGAPASLSPAPDVPAGGAGDTLVQPGDPRSEGSGPGLVGDPLVILAGVVLLGVATAAVTAAAVRLSGRRPPPAERP